MDALVSQQRLTRLLYEISFLLVLALVLLPISGLTERRAFALASALAFACFAIVLAWKAGRTDVPHRGVSCRPFERGSFDQELAE